MVLQHSTFEVGPSDGSPTRTNRGVATCVMCVRSYSSADLLAMVDNYGLLCLDIAWTYFKLQDINNLKDAGWRLQKVHESHGLRVI